MMNQAYRALLRIYPAWHRTRFADEMTEVFSIARRDELQAGRAAYAIFLFTEFAGLFRGALSTWASVWDRNPARYRRRALIVSLIAGAIAVLLMESRTYTGIRPPRRVSTPSIYSQADQFALLVMICICCVLLAVLLIAFFWLVERSLRARTSQRYESLHRHTRRAGRQLRGAGW